MAMLTLPHAATGCGNDGSLREGPRVLQEATKSAPERLAADYGLWVGSYTRGELPEMRAHAAAFLDDIKRNTRVARS